MTNSKLFFEDELVNNCSFNELDTCGLRSSTVKNVSEVRVDYGGLCITVCDEADWYDGI